MATYTQLQENDVLAIARDYALQVVDFAPIEGGAGNSSYWLTTQSYRYVLTVFDDKAFAYVVRLGQLLMLLAEYQFPTTRIVPPTQGGIATIYQGKPVMMKRYITGQVQADLDDTMLSQIGVTLAKLHQIPAPDWLSDHHPYGRQTFATVIGSNSHPDYENWLADRSAHLEQHIPSGLPRGLIHGDLFYDNVLVEGGQFQAIIDFEEACHYYSVFDLGMAILGLCAQGTTFALNKARALLTGYQQVRQLEAAEKATLQLFVEYAAIATSFWRFWKFRIHLPTEEKADHYMTMVNLAEAVRNIPEAEFQAAVFAPNVENSEVSE
jgi:homoserine kinase type II